MIICISLLVVVFVSWHGWRLFGFNTCISPENLVFFYVAGDEDGFRFYGTSGDNGPAFIGYTYKTINNELYIGLKYSSLYGFTKPNGGFDFIVPCNPGQIARIHITDGTKTMLLFENYS